MRCERCNGRGSIERTIQPKEAKFINHMVCPDCNGSGIGHCCDGLMEQPCPTPKEKPNA